MKKGESVFGTLIIAVVFLAIAGVIMYLLVNSTGVAIGTISELCIKKIESENAGCSSLVLNEETLEDNKYRKCLGLAMYKDAKSDKYYPVIEGDALEEVASQCNEGFERSQLTSANVCVLDPKVLKTTQSDPVTSAYCESKEA